MEKLRLRCVGYCPGCQPHCNCRIICLHEISWTFILSKSFLQSFGGAVQMKESMPLASRDIKVSFAINILDDHQLIRGMEWVKAGIFKRHSCAKTKKKVVICCM